MRLRCDVCRRWKRTLIGNSETDQQLCNDCYERLDQLDRDHRRPAFLFAREIVRNAEAARMEGVR